MERIYHFFSLNSSDSRCFPKIRSAAIAAAPAPQKAASGADSPALTPFVFSDANALETVVLSIVVSDAAGSGSSVVMRLLPAEPDSPVRFVFSVGSVFFVSVVSFVDAVLSAVCMLTVVSVLSETVNCSLCMSSAVPLSFALTEC